MQCILMWMMWLQLAFYHKSSEIYSLNITRFTGPTWCVLLEFFWVFFLYIVQTDVPTRTSLIHNLSIFLNKVHLVVNRIIFKHDIIIIWFTKIKWILEMIEAFKTISQSKIESARWRDHHKVNLNIAFGEMVVGWRCLYWLRHGNITTFLSM